MDHRIWIAEALAEDLAGRNAANQRLVECVVHHHLVGVDRAATSLLADAQRVERGEGVGAELDAGADLAELRRLLEYLHLKALAYQRERGGDAADATAGDEDRKRSRRPVHEVLLSVNQSLNRRGVASAQDIATAISYGSGLRWALLGPFLNLHASGGPGGITQLLQHLGPAQREWARDLGTYPETDDYIKPIAEGVKAELDTYDFNEMLRQRDKLLVELLAAKKKLSQIP